ELPTHTHTLNGSTAQAPSVPPIDPDTNTVLSASTPQNIYAPAANVQAMASNAVANVGGSQAHLNMQPFLVLNFSIALQGIVPSEIEERIDGTTLCRRDPHVRRQLRASRVDVLRRPAAADLRVRDTVQSDRNHLRRRRAEHIRAPGSPWSHSHPPGQRLY